jgi:hypothetical protein
MHGTHIDIHRLVTVSKLTMEVFCSSHPFPHAISRIMPNKFRTVNVRMFDVCGNGRDLLLQLFDHCTVFTSSRGMLFTIKKNTHVMPNSKVLFYDSLIN